MKVTDSPHLVASHSSLRTVTELVRRLIVDVARFEQHAREVANHAISNGARAESLCADVRADAYGHSKDIVKPVFTKSGFRHFLTDDGCASAAHDQAHIVIDAELLYGFASSNEDHSPGGFTTFVGEVVNVKRVPAGQRISYGYTYSTAAESTVALVSLGYADGVTRRASSIATVRIGAHAGTIAGRIAMDQFVVDMGDAPVRIGDEAMIWGSAELGYPTVSNLSALTGIAPLALTSLVGYRVHREASPA
jgi:alanine racemase